MYAKLLKYACLSIRHAPVNSCVWLLFRIANRAYPGSCDFEVDTCQWETSAPVQPSGTSWKRRHGPIRPNASSLKNPSNSDSGRMEEWPF